MAQRKLIRLAFSPDADDAFMFHALLAGHVSHADYQFVARRADTEALNSAATGADPDEVIAISIAHYPRVASRYLLLAHGGSVGAGYGPVVVAPTAPPDGADAMAALAGRRIAVPGLNTTAFVTLSLLAREAAVTFEPVVVPIQPHAAVFESLARRDVDAALLIHEGRLTYPSRGLSLWLDLGAAWKSLTGQSLPLGGNAIRRDLGARAVHEISSLLRASIAWSFGHRDEVLDELASQGSVLDRAGLDDYLRLYANDDTLDYGSHGREAIATLLDRAARAGLIASASLEFAPG